MGKSAGNVARRSIFLSSVRIRSFPVLPMSTHFEDISACPLCLYSKVVHFNRPLTKLLISMRGG